MASTARQETRPTNLLNKPITNLLDKLMSLPCLTSCRWRVLPWLIMVTGLVGIGLGVAGSDLRQLGFSWLVAFAFFLSIALGALFLVMMHHLFDAAWSTPLRRILEHLACLMFPALAALFVPLALLAGRIYPDFNGARFFVLSILCLGGWGVLAHRLRHCSLEQDKTGAASCTHKMRAWSAGGIIFFALSVTTASSLWIKAVNGNWFSTIYGVWYFSASVWVCIAVLYLIGIILQKTGQLRDVLREEQFYFLGSLFLAFTLFYGYICYSQYFIIWNANIPEETGWYSVREQGVWKSVGYLILFGHFLLPFLLLLRANWKLKLSVILPLCVWACLMHFLDLQFQIMPILHPTGWTAAGVATDFGCLLFFGGAMARVFLHYLMKHPAYAQRDPRMAEALGIHAPPTTHIATAPERLK